MIRSRQRVEKIDSPGILSVDLERIKSSEAMAIVLPRTEVGEPGHVR